MYDGVAPHRLDGEPSPERIQQLGSAFRASRALLSAVELGVFTALASGPLDSDALAERVGIHPRGATDFFDALVALGLLDRREGQYFNTAETDWFLDAGKPSYIGAMAEMHAVGGYRVWASLTAALRTGEPQTDAKGDFSVLYQDERRTRRYLRAMTAGSLYAARAIARRFPWDQHRVLLDVGTAEGCLPVQVAVAHPHLSAVGIDLPPVAPFFTRYVASFGLADRVCFHAADVRRDPLPSADVVVFGHILSDLSAGLRAELLSRAWSALPAHGAVIVYDSVIDDDRRANASALLTSVGMLLQGRDGRAFTGRECRGWLEHAHFVNIRVEPLDGPRAMVVGHKATSGRG